MKDFFVDIWYVCTKFVLGCFNSLFVFLDNLRRGAKVLLAFDFGTKTNC